MRCVRHALCDLQRNVQGHENLFIGMHADSGDERGSEAGSLVSLCATFVSARAAHSHRTSRRKLQPETQIHVALVSDALPERRAEHGKEAELSEHRLVPKAYRAVFTSQADEFIRAEYRRMLQGRRPYSVKERLGSQLGVPGWVAQRRAAELGITRVKEPRWSEEELELLVKHAWKHPKNIAATFRRHGFQRSANAVWLMVKRRFGGPTAHRPWYTATQLASLLGIDSHLVLRWISSGQLKAERAGTERTERQGGDFHKIRSLDFRKFVAANPHVIDLRKVDALWFIDLLTNYQANRFEETNEARPARQSPPTSTPEPSG
jgi:hypothetical protein